MNEKKYVPVYSIEKMMELVRAGYVVKYVTDNINNKKMKVFMFVYQDGIEECF